MGSRIKNFFLVVALTCSSLCGYSQTYAEFFRQKRTQEKYLLKQLAYLKLYGGYLKKGYEVVSGGLETIKELTSGELGLHEAFISGLSTVSLVVKKDHRVAEIISLQLAIAKSFREISNQPGLEGANRLYVTSVRQELMGQCAADLDDLLDIVLSGKLEMSEDERLSRLSKVHDSMREKADFTSYFSSEVLTLLKNRNSQESDIKWARRMYEKN